MISFKGKTLNFLFIKMDIFKKDIHLLFIQLQIGYGIPYIYLINFTSYKKTRYITQFKKTIDEEKNIRFG